MSCFLRSCCKGFVRAPEVCRMSPFFVLVGFGECLDNCQKSFLPRSYYEGLVAALEVCRTFPRFVFLRFGRGQRLVICPLPSSLRVVRVAFGLGGLPYVPFLGV